MLSGPPPEVDPGAPPYKLAGFAGLTADAGREVVTKLCILMAAVLGRVWVLRLVLPLYVCRPPLPPAVYELFAPLLAP